VNPLGWIQGLEGAVLVTVICLLLFIEESGIPLPFAPGDLLLAIGGIAIAAGRVHPAVMPLAAVAAIVAGAVVGRELFALLGWKRLMRVAGPLRLGVPLERASALLERNGWRAVFTARLVPGLRVHTTQVAGVRRLPRRTFLAGLVPAAIVYVVAFEGLGLAFGRPILELIRRAEHQALLVVATAVAAAVLLLWLRGPAQRAFVALGGWTGLFRIQLDTPGVVLIPACIGLNVAGHSLAVALRLPLFLDTIGTVLCALVLGPWVGGSVGFITNLVISNTIDPLAAPYAVVSFLVGFAAGAATLVRRRSGWRTWLGLSLACFLIASVLSTPINLLFNDGRSGVALGDALFQRLSAGPVPVPIASLLAEAAIDLPDKLLTVLVALLIYRGLPAPQPEGGGLALDLRDAFLHVFRSRRWLQRTLAAAGCLLFAWLVVPYLALAGYTMAVARGARQGETELPGWRPLGSRVRDGSLLSLVLLLWYLPGIAVGVPADLARSASDAEALPNGALGALDVVAGLWGLLVLLLQAPIWSQYLSGGVGAALDVAAIARRIRFNVGLTTVVAAVGVVLAVAAAAGFALFVVGALVTIPWAGWVWAQVVGAYARMTDPAVVAGAPAPEPRSRQSRVPWPEHLPVGALRVVRWSARYGETVTFYRDVIGLPVLETFHDSYGLDGTILGLPGTPVHLEIVRLTDARHPTPGLDQLVLYLPDAAAQERIMARLAAAGVEPIAQIDYWQTHGGVTYPDPDGREVVFAPWIYSPGS
jgi:energy-coupling factor transport system substrate-specific component